MFERFSVRVAVDRLLDLRAGRVAVGHLLFYPVGEARLGQKLLRLVRTVSIVLNLIVIPPDCLGYRILCWLRYPRIESVDQSFLVDSVVDSLADSAVTERCRFCVHCNVRGIETRACEQ